MNPEEIAELKQLIEFLKENNIGEFELERGDLKVRLRFGGAAGEPATLAQLAQFSQLMSAPAQPAAASAPAAAVVAHAHPGTGAPAAPAAPAAADSDAGLHIVKSPIVGTFYESSAPGAPAFVKAGDMVEAGQVLCIVEAMKLMNEIESDATGEIVQRFVTNGQPVEYGQRLYSVRPR
jgi:acetyl-CoA carboxylase biotin carboxyl carrier protein